MNLALFDLDNTLIAGDSDFEWAQFLIAKGVVDREIQEAKNMAFYDQYKEGTLDIDEFLAFQLAPHPAPRPQHLLWPQLLGPCPPRGCFLLRHRLPLCLLRVAPAAPAV